MSSEAVAKLMSRVRLAVGRAILRGVDDTRKLQSLQVELLAGEVRDDVERFQDYGFTSHPHPGAECIAVAVGGSRDHVVVIKADDRRYRVKGLQPGEVAIYTDEGDIVIFKRGGVIEFTASAKVVMNTPLVEISGDLVVAGDVLGKGKSLPHHTHMEQGDGAPVSPPL